MRFLLALLPMLAAAVFLSGCSFSITVAPAVPDDEMVSIAISFSDGSTGTVELQNSKGSWEGEVPSTIKVRKAGDRLLSVARTKDGRTSLETLNSEMSAEIRGAAGYSKFARKDAIADKYRTYPSTLVMRISAPTGT